MKDFRESGTPLRQKFSVLIAMLFCLFVSGIEYIPQHQEANSSEQSTDNPDQTFLNIAVDAVVPFVIHVADTVLYLIYQVFSFELKIPEQQAISAPFSNQLIEILFERIISTKGP
jgi:hypothetical protein